MSKVMTLRKALLMPFPCRWNAWVRDWTARLERKPDAWLQEENDEKVGRGDYPYGY